MWRDKSWRRQALMHLKWKIPDSWRTGWKAKACSSFALYLKVFKNHLYYLWHVRVLSIKPCLHTQLPENNRSDWKVSGVGAFDHLEWTYDGAFEQLFGLGRGEFEQKFSKNSNARGVARGGWLSFELTGTLYFSNMCLQPHEKVYACIEQRVWEIGLENLL